jgi:tetratricopeptide (TPR) repeat protein
VPKQPLAGAGFNALAPIMGVERMIERGRQLSTAGKIGEAIAIYQQLRTIDPLNTDVLLEFGNALARAKHLRAAIEQYENALRIDPELSEAWLRRGNALADIGRMEEALKCYVHYNELLPEQTLGYFHQAALLYRLGRFAEAVEVYDIAESYSPGNPDIQISRGPALCWAGRHQHALAGLDRTIAQFPTAIEAYINRGMQKILCGDLIGGFQDFEWRWKRRDLATHDRVDYSQPRWLGHTDLAGKTLLLWDEQGLGDTLQFCRYGIVAARAGARVILDVPQALVRLMKTVPEISSVNVSGTMPPDFDLHCPLMSLPLAFGTTVDTIPSFPRYLIGEPDLIQEWRDRLEPLKGIRVGLVWAGSSRWGNADLVATDQRRSMALATLAPLAEIDGCDLISLQLGPPAQQMAAPPAGMILHDFTENLNDFADTAALVENLDLVIAVDTSVAHLTGALGKPIWLMNRFDTCWRWLLDRDDSPWYPTLRQFRQTSPGDWNGVVTRVAEALREFAAT